MAGRFGGLTCTGVFSAERVGSRSGKHVVFGEVTSGTELVQLMESLGSGEGATSKKVAISNCGELLPGQEMGAAVDGFALFPDSKIDEATQVAGIEKFKVGRRNHQRKRHCRNGTCACTECW
jgi:hypothetical protein